MPNLKLTVEYDGTAFHGWQAQAGLRTVQGELVRGLNDLVRRADALQPVDVRGASRTDRGVHALGQTASVAIESRIPPRQFAAALNSRLPFDVRIRQAEEVDPEFHARHAACGKHYRYAIAEGFEPGVFVSRYLEPIAASVDLAAMREAASRLEGERDFASLRAAGGGAEDSTVRTLDAVEARRDGRVLLVDVWGRSFLYKMVRAIVGTLLEVGKGRWSSCRIEEILASCDRSRAGPTAAARGLCLVHVFYDEDAYRGNLRCDRGFFDLLEDSVELPASGGEGKGGADR